MNIIAHRGYSDIAPENTLASFDLAIDKGFNIFELDVQLTKDRCDERLQHHLDDGVPIDRLKAVLDSRDLSKEIDSTYQQYAGPSSTDSVK